MSPASPLSGLSSNRHESNRSASSSGSELEYSSLAAKQDEANNIDPEYANGPVFESKEELSMVLRQKMDEAMVPVMNDNPYKLYNSSLRSHGQRDVLSGILLDAVKDVKGTVREPESTRKVRKAEKRRSRH